MAVATLPRPVCEIGTESCETRVDIREFGECGDGTAHCGVEIGIRPAPVGTEEPIGSGGIESANKCLCHVRLKRSGAWWYVEKAHQMLAWRCAQYNGTVDRVFEAYRQKAKQSSPRVPHKK